jgi:hypothetical protein
LRLGPPGGHLRRISNAPPGHRFPPQPLTTLIKRPLVTMGRDECAYSPTCGACQGIISATLSTVMAGLVPAIPLRDALCPPKRDHRDKPGDDSRGAMLNVIASQTPTPGASTRRTLPLQGRDKKAGGIRNQGRDRREKPSLPRRSRPPPARRGPRPPSWHPCRWP